MQNNSVEMFVLYHPEADQTVYRHLAWWLFASESLRLLCGADTIRHSVHASIAEPCGVSGYSGPQSIHRLVEVMSRAGVSKCESVIVTEYDAVTFRAAPPHPLDGSIVAPLMTNENPGYYACAQYPHPVWYMQSTTAQRIARCAHMQPIDSEGGYGDRWLAALCARLCIPIRNDPGVFSRDQDLLERNPDDLERARQCLRRGGWCIHGVKTARVLDTLAHEVGR